MECREAAELLDAYILGALDPEERDGVEAHLDGCSDCERRLRRDGELVAQMAFAAPPLAAPARVKLQLFERIDRAAASEAEPPAPEPLNALNWLAGFRRAVAGHARLAMAAAFAAAVIGGGFWFDNRIDTVSRENSALKAQLQDAADAEGEMMDMIKEQRDLAYMLASPDKLVSVLTSTSQATANAGAEAQGMIIFEGEGGSAFLTARELPANNEGSLYRVWLVKDGQRHDAGVFSVDPTGYGQAVIIPVGSWEEIEAIEITSVPTGESVLQGDL